MQSRPGEAERRDIQGDAPQQQPLPGTPLSAGLTALPDAPGIDPRRAGGRRRAYVSRSPPASAAWAAASRATGTRNGEQET